MVPWVKICGVRNAEDAQFAFDHGADAVGLMFAKSKRQLTFEEAKNLCQSLAPRRSGQSLVGVFVNEDPAHVRTCYQECGLDLVQLHGDESDEYIQSLRLPVIRVIRVREQQDLSVADERFHNNAVLLDSYSPDERGGSGKIFAWDKAKKLADAGISFYLAGGLTPENVRDALMISGASGVDVSSGVESNGLKDLSKIKHFIDQAKKK